jgi:hypothetical protein
MQANGSERQTDKGLNQALSPKQRKIFELLGPPSLVAGEDESRYWQFVAAVVQTANPNDIQDHIYIRDEIDLEWSVLRYRRAKAHLITQSKSDSRTHLMLEGMSHDTAPEDQVIAHAIGELIPDLRRLDLMIEAAEVRRDRAYRELERRRGKFAKEVRKAVAEQSRLEASREGSTTPDQPAA